MDKDILALLANGNGGFSKGQKRIAQYILNNYDKAAFMTAGRLGETVGVSESTVVRFAAELGYDGYPSMRKALQEMIRSRLTSVQRIEVARQTLNTDNLIRSVISADAETLEMTLNECDRDSFDKAVEAIISAKRVYIVGMRSSACLANYLGYYFNILLENVYIIHDTAVSEVYEQMMRISEGDVFIGISYPRYSSRTLRAMRFAKSTGASVIGITDAESSPFVGVADTLLYAKSNMVSFLDSLVAPLSLINALVVSVGAKLQTDIESTFNRLESIWKDYEVYETGEM